MSGHPPGSPPEWISRYRWFRKIWDSRSPVKAWSVRPFVRELTPGSLKEPWFPETQSPAEPGRWILRA